MIQLSTALESVALESQLNTLELLLVDGLDVNTQSKDGQTLLHWAAQRGHLDATELLLKNGADPDAKDKFVVILNMWAKAAARPQMT